MTSEYSGGAELVQIFHVGQLPVPRGKDWPNGFTLLFCLAGGCHPSASQALAASVSFVSKYLILAIVNGLQTTATHFLSPTRAIRLILVQCVVENLISSQSAFASQPWKSWNCARMFTFPSLAISASTR